MKDVRKASFAGSWYPASAAACEKEIKSYLNDFSFPANPPKNYIGGIVPHAGWYFSGSLACRVIAALSGSDGNPATDVIAVFGMHMRPDAAPCIMAEGAWETPFGSIEIAAGLAGELLQNVSFTIETPDHFTPDNTIELQLPFVKYFFNNARLLPIGVPPSDLALKIARDLVQSAKRSGLSLKVIGSTDLTHYGPNYGYTPAGSGKAARDWVQKENDRRIIDRILKMDTGGMLHEGLNNFNACCSGAAAAAVATADGLGAENTEFVEYLSSYEKHPGDSFVGYAGILFY